MKKKDVIITTWEFGKRNLSFSFDQLEKDLREKFYNEEEILYSKAFVEKYFDGISQEGYWSIDPGSYVNLLNYEEVQIAKRSIKKTNISIWIAIAALLITILLGFIKIEPLKTFDFSNKGTAKSTKVINPISDTLTKPGDIR